MKLQIKDVNLSTGGPVVAILNEADAVKLGVHAGDRVKLRRLRKKKYIKAVADISTKGIEPGEIGLFEEALKLLAVEEGTHIDVVLSARPTSVQYIKEKLQGQHLVGSKISKLIYDIVDNNFSEVEMTYFVSAC